MMVIEITEDKLDALGEHIGKMLKYGGKAMECIEELSEKGRMGERYPMDDDERYMERYGERGRYGDMGERRGRDSRGRFTRY